MTPRRRIIPIFVPHAGCPNNCVFCNQKRISGSLFSPSAETVRDTLAKLPSGAGYELAFYGGSFTAIPDEKQEELLSAAKDALDRGAICSIRVSTRPDAIDSGKLERLRRHGVSCVELGVQSMCDDVLLASGRGHTAGDTVNAAGLIRRMGLGMILQMMTGLPGSSRDKDIETARQIIRLFPDGVRIYPTVIIRDTELEDMWKRGEYSPHTVEDAVEICARILLLFEDAGIPVIRLGLNPTEELSSGSAVAGAYHPALGELVRSRILREEMETLLDQHSTEKGGRVILVKENLLSAAVGQHRENLVWLKERFPHLDVKIRPYPLESARIQLQITRE